MANQVTNYKCPACTGPLRFDSATGKLQCDFCGSSYEVAEVEKLYAEKDAQAAGAFRQAEEQAAADGEWTAASGSDWGADAEKLRVYSCPSCGAELICDETTSATSCPYCGNNTIVPGQFSGALKPDYVLPFKLDKAAAVAALKKHYGGKKLLLTVVIGHDGQIHKVHARFTVLNAYLNLRPLRYHGFKTVFGKCGAVFVRSSHFCKAGFCTFQNAFKYDFAVVLCNFRYVRGFPVEFGKRKCRRYGSHKKCTFFLK